MAEVWTVRCKQRCVRAGVKCCNNLLGGVSAALRISGEVLKNDYRMWWQARDPLEDLRKRQRIGPDERDATAKSREPGVERRTPQTADRARTGDHEGLPGLWEY